MATFIRKVRVSKTEAFAIDKTSWQVTEEITLLSVVSTDGNVIITGTEIDGGLLKCLATGVNIGNAELIFSFSTATRSGCEPVTVKVIADC